MHEFEELAPILDALIVAERKQVAFDADIAASDLSLPRAVVQERADAIDRFGLALTDHVPPMVLHAGRQYLTAGGRVDQDVLRFLPRTIGNLDTRAALLHAGAVMVDEFRAAVVGGTAIEHAQAIVPSAFAPAITERVAVDLFAAAVALMARLCGGEPAGCVAEEILAVELMEGARDWIEMQTDNDALTRADARVAAGEIASLFALFEDDDVLDMFDMQEPADAAVAGQSERVGVVDQRLEAWFEPFGWTITTGYLGGRITPRV